MFDQLIVGFDKALRTVFTSAPTTRSRPGVELPENEMSPNERRHAAGLMRVNHVGEVCAQALYQGQALSSRTPETRAALEQAAWEETEHLNWTETRIAELGGHKSFLNPVWYAGALTMGLAAGRFGDRWNLGFLAETERQVGAHLNDHLQTLPAADQRSRAIVTQMAQDEAEHAATAVQLGGAELPEPVKVAMRLSSKIMTNTAYFI